MNSYNARFSRQLGDWTLKPSIRLIFWWTLVLGAKMSCCRWFPCCSHLLLIRHQKRVVLEGVIRCTSHKSLLKLPKRVFMDLLHNTKHTIAGDTRRPLVVVSGFGAAVSFGTNWEFYTMKENENRGKLLYIREITHGEFQEWRIRAWKPRLHGNPVSMETPSLLHTLLLNNWIGPFLKILFHLFWRTQHFCNSTNKKILAPSAVSCCFAIRFNILKKLVIIS